MNEELSRRDVAGVERGHQALESLGQLIPVIGFLGTVVGLAMGMLSFPDIANVEAPRSALKSFAAR